MRTTQVHRSRANKILSIIFVPVRNGRPLGTALRYLSGWCFEAAPARAQQSQVSHSLMA
jgi:hypothetical protein